MWNWIQRLPELKKARRDFVLAQIIDTGGSTPREVGAKMVVFADGTIEGTIGGGRLEQEVITSATELLVQEGNSLKLKIPLGAKVGQCCGGVVEVFLEAVRSSPKLYLFGAGHVGQAVCKTLEETPFEVHVIDERPEWIKALPCSVVKHQVSWEDFIDKADWDEETYVAIMTHQHDQDQAILEKVVAKPHRYLGLIGSDAKWKRFQDRLRQRGVTDLQLARVHCPLGVARMGKAPKEVAISLAAELLHIHHEAK